MRFFFLLFFLLIFLPACGGPDRIQFSQTQATESQSSVPTIRSVVLDHASPMNLSVGGLVPLHATLILSNNETLPGLTQEFQVGTFNGEVQWFSSNPEVIRLDSQGVMTALKPGVSTIKVSVMSAASLVDVVVSQENTDQQVQEEKPVSKTVPQENPGSKNQQPENQQPQKIKPEPPHVFANAFLGPQDHLTMTYGTNAGYGQHLFPDIVYGLPKTGGTNVVSFGGGGSLLIELHDYLIVDGPGPDFTIFENPVEDDQGRKFSERAEVSVSEDGVNYSSFNCDAFDPQQVYQGCAGVEPVHALENPLDPTVSGGDFFDLSEVGLDVVRYIRITDMNTCKPGDPTYPLCSQPGEQGFDLDAMALVNGVNE